MPIPPPPPPSGWGSVILGLPAPTKLPSTRLREIRSDLEPKEGAWIWMELEGVAGWHFAKHEPYKDLQWYIDQEVYCGSKKMSLNQVSQS